MHYPTFDFSVGCGAKSARPLAHMSGAMPPEDCGQQDIAIGRKVEVLEKSMNTPVTRI